MKAPPLSLGEAQQRLLALAPILPLVRVDTPSALGRYLAEPLLARRTQPAADQSAMDGYAVTLDNMAGPWRVIGESAAGHPFDGSVGPGEAVRISTGALMPDGAQAVVLQEDVARADHRITLTGTPPSPPGKHIRRRGNDFAEGADLLPAGTRIGPAQLALALAAGHKHLPVRRLPRVAVIDSGDELAADCENCAPHQVPASNGAMIAAMAAALPCTLHRIGPVADRLEAIEQALESAADADLIVTSGGASVGDHDLIRPALERWGAQIDFWRVNIKPGKPLLVATRGHQLVLGLPGNPVSSHVTATLFLLPLLRAILGASNPLPLAIPARLGAPIGQTGNRQEFVRAVWDGENVSPLTMQDSGALASLAASNALINRPADSAAAAAGDAVSIFLLENGGSA